MEHWKIMAVLEPREISTGLIHYEVEWLAEKYPCLNSSMTAFRMCLNSREIPPQEEW
jgi:hypothetical protein